MGMRRRLALVVFALAPLIACGGASIEPGVDAAQIDAALDGSRPDATEGLDATSDLSPPDATLPDLDPLDAALDLALPDAAPDLGPPPTACQSRYAQPRAIGTLDDPVLIEISGLAPSLTRAGVLWGHTDSGGEARLYAIDQTGALRGSVGLPFDNIDFEDIAAAPCPDSNGPCLWVADTGDNRLARASVFVYAVPEPVVVAGDAEQVWRYELTYPQGPIDSEALAVSPDGRTLYLFEKIDGPIARVYGVTDPSPDAPNALVEITRFAAPGIAIDNGRSITGADLHPTGERLAIRVYTGSYEYRFGEGQGPADLSAIDPITIALGPLAEPQGEAICYDRAGFAVWTVSEDPERAGGQPLHRYDCRD